MLPQKGRCGHSLATILKGKRSAGKKRRRGKDMKGKSAFLPFWKSVVAYEPTQQRIKEGSSIVLCACALFLFLALFTHDIQDPGWSHTGSSEFLNNVTGPTGAWLSDALFSLFGLIAYLFPAFVCFSGYLVYCGTSNQSPKNMRPRHLWALRIGGFLMALLSACALASMHWQSSHALPIGSGGYLGSSLSNWFVTYLSPIGATVMLLAFFLAGMTFLTGISWLRVTDFIGAYGLKVAQMLQAKYKAYRAQPTQPRKVFKRPTLADLPKLMPPQNKAPKIVRYDHDDEKSVPPIQPKENKSAKLKPVHATTSRLKPTQVDAVCAPSLNLLDEAEENDATFGYSEEELNALSQLVEQRLEEFGIGAQVVAVHPGPVITRFELSLAPGIKVSRITALAKDLARALSVVSVRIVEIIPGKPVIGLEIPNNDREIVRLKTILEHSNYQKGTSPLTLALGKDISGRAVTADLSKMPHLLVAGTTGSGKSVGLNAMLLSILYKATPNEVRLIMIDPKMLELAIYDNIPHLLTPVVTDMKEAANALRWCVNEMERRYQLMAALGVRHMAGFNRKVDEAAAKGTPITDPLWTPIPGEEAPYLEHLPYIVVVVDEFADMMMVVGKKVEELIARIAQKARAAGIHLILATQRPSVDVITGLIKANIPTRISFQVSSKIDSRTILDQMGAEQLLGHGDMLYLPPGVGIPTRIHGAFVADEEVHKVVQELRRQAPPNYIDSVVTTQQIMTNFTGSGEDEEDDDELYDQSVYIVTESRRASISNLQRRLKIGYNRAARIIEQMEREGVVSAVQSNGGREVLAPPPVES